MKFKIIRKELSDDGNVNAVVGFAGEFDAPFNLRKQRVVAADADIRSGAIFRTALTDNDVSGDDSLTAGFLYAQTTTFRVASVSCAAACFLMCHGLIS